MARAKPWFTILALMAGMTLTSPSWAQACLVHSQAERLDVKVCQQNVSIPAAMFHESFCQPRLAGQRVATEYLESCPAGAFGVCRNAQVANMPYREDIHYYGVASDALYLKPFCEGQSQGRWVTPR